MDTAFIIAGVLVLMVGYATIVSLVSREPLGVFFWFMSFYATIGLGVGLIWLGVS